MKIFNVSADIDSQKAIRQQAIVNVEKQVKAEVYAAARVEAEAEAEVQETPKEARKKKRVLPEEV